MFRFLVVTLFCCHFICGEEMSAQKNVVFMTPVIEGKTDKLKQTIYDADQEANFFSEIGISKYRRWIQKIHDDFFLIHHVEGTNPVKSLEILSQKIIENDPIAIYLHSLYKEALGIDLLQENLIPQMVELTEVVCVDVEHDSGTLIKEYCFVYPLIPSKKEKLFQIYQDKAVYLSEQMQELRRFRGVSKQQMWIQESAEKPYIVVFQEITGSVNDARNKYLSAQNEELSSHIAREHSDITGLSFEELLPILESLDDNEVLM